MASDEDRLQDRVAPPSKRQRGGVDDHERQETPAPEPSTLANALVAEHVEPPLPLPPPDAAALLEAQRRAADDATTDAGLLETICCKNALSELGVTFEVFRDGLSRRTGAHPRILEIVRGAGRTGLSLLDLRHLIKAQLRLQKGVRGPYLLEYLKHFSDAYRIEGGPMPRDVHVFAAFQNAAA